MLLLEFLKEGDNFVLDVGGERTDKRRDSEMVLECVVEDVDVAGWAVGLVGLGQVIDRF